MTDGFSPPAPARAFGAAWLAGTAQAQRRMWSEALCTWTRRPLPSTNYARRLGEGQRFSLHRGAWMSVLVPMVVIAQFVDVLVAQGVIHVAGGAHRTLLHAALLVVSVWSVVWAVSLRSATRQVDHVLGPHALTLAVGFKQLCRLPLAAIADVRPIDHQGGAGGKDWHAGFGLRASDVTVLSPIDPPPLLIALKADANGAWWTRNGATRPLRRWIAVYVDKPDAMRAAVLDAIAALPPSAAPQH